MKLSYRKNYWDSPELKAEFIAFMKQIHGIELSLWNEMGFWDDKYRPFSYFSGDTLVSNACVYSMDMTVQGKRCQVAQISAVGTIPEYRRKGLSYELNQKAIAWARDNHDFFYLFADEEAVKLYEKCGFRPVDQYRARIPVDGKSARPGAVKLDIQRKDDLEQIYRYASERTPVSEVLGVSNKKLFMFWCLNFLKDNIYYVADLDILVLYKRSGGIVTIFDIVGKKIPSFSAIYPYICDKDDETVEFHFMVDKLNVGSFEEIRVEDNDAFVIGNFPLKNTRFIFPLTAKA